MTRRQAFYLFPLVAIAAGLCLTASPTSAQTARPSVELAGHPIAQIAVTTTDLGRATGFYRDTLGLPFLFEANDMAFFNIGGIRLMIALDQDRPQTVPTSIVYFDAPNFDAVQRRLAASGAVLEGPVETVQRSPAGDLKIQQFRDPDGNVLAIMGTVPHS